MNIGFETVLFNIAAMALMAIPGFILIKAKIYDFSNGLVFMLLYICQPLISFVSFQKVSYSSQVLVNLGYTAIFSFIGIGLLFLISYPIFNKFEIDKAKVYRFGAVFSNCSFMGIPLLQALFGIENPEIIVYANIFVVAFNLISWSAGVFAISGDKKYINLRAAIINPPTIAFLVALPLFLLNFSLEGYSLFTNRLFYSLSSVANMITPLSMILIGMNLAKSSFREIFSSIGVYTATAIKLFIAPLLMFLLLLPFKINIVVEAALIFSMAMPTATTTVVFAQRFGANTKEASSLVAVSTLICLLSVPLIFLVLF